MKMAMSFINNFTVVWFLVSFFSLFNVIDVHISHQIRLLLVREVSRPSENTKLSHSVSWQWCIPS